MNELGNIRDSVRNNLMQVLQSGELAVNTTINLAKLARELGVSVTPIREALTQLEHVGIIKAIKNRGFVVADLALDEAKNLYRTVADIEVLALEDSNFTDDSIAQLEAQHLALVQTHTLEHRIKAHFEFHRLLTSTANPILVNILTNLRTRMLFYEQHYIKKSAFYENVDNQNEAIISAIKDDNLPTAELILKMNWAQVLDHLVLEMSKQKSVIYTEIVG